MAVEAAAKEKAVSHLNKAKGEVDAAWSALREAEGDSTNVCILVSELGLQVDKPTGIGKDLGLDFMKCNVCHEVIKPNEPCYQLRQGSIEDDNITFLLDEDAGYYHQLCLVGLP